MLEDPVRAAGGTREAGGDAVAGAVDAIFVEEVCLCYDACHVDALVVAHAAAVVAGGGKVGELVLVYFVAAD